MKRAIIKSMLIITLLLLMSVVSYALTSGAGELTLVLEYNNSPLRNIDLSIVRVADASESGKRIVYTLTSDFAGCTVDLGDLSTENNIAMSGVLSRHVRINNISVTTATTNSNGTVKYTNLEPGLYLVMMSANSRYVMTSVVVPVPMVENDGFVNYLVTAYPKIEPIPEDTEPPDTNPPDTDPPDTDPPDTDPPDTNPPDTDPPDTNPPDTNPPDTNPPDTNPPEETTGPPEETISPPEETTESPPQETIYVEGIGELTPTEVDGVYMIIGEDGVPLYYMYDDDLGEWIEVDEFGVPLGSLERPAGELPQTGLLRWPVPVLTGSGMILTAAGVIVTGRGKKRDED